MNTIFKYPASKLPAELREGFDDNALVNVQVTNADHILPGYTKEDIDGLVAPAIEEEKRGEGTICQNPNDFDTYFNAIKDKVHAKHNS